MIFIRASDITLPRRLRNPYRVLRALLFIAFLSLSSVFIYRTLFPSQEFSFSFRNPDASGNSLEIPYVDDSLSVKNGHVPANSTFVTYAGTMGVFSSARVIVTLENDSLLAENGTVNVSVRKSYRACFLPDGEPVQATPKERALSVHGVPYLFSTDTLYPFISDRAALSRFPKEEILTASDEILSIFPPEETPVGFREGTFLSDAQGVYAIDGEGKARPIGSSDIFESLGFHWNDVILVDEEELGFHKRGKILLQDGVQPDGTLFHDTDTDSYWIVSEGRRHQILDKGYLESLRAVTTPIESSGNALSTSASCVLQRSRIPFIGRRTLLCDLPLGSLKNFPGGSISLSISTNKEIHLASLRTVLRTEPDRENFGMFLRQIRERFQTTYSKR
ncbi:MAG: hypothetical protein HGB34_01405 [Candidatus Moranbacteria bacterium]|nr:hypothetical protein [Candidatus Moranbacteria bacterium]